jgi:hypothetical protein
MCGCSLPQRSDFNRLQSWHVCMRMLYAVYCMLYVACCVYEYMVMQHAMHAVPLPVVMLHVAHCMLCVVCCVLHVTRAQADRIQPELSCVAALHSPSTGIVDSHAFMLVPPLVPTGTRTLSPIPHTHVCFTRPLFRACADWHLASVRMQSLHADAEAAGVIFAFHSHVTALNRHAGAAT